MRQIHIKNGYIYKKYLRKNLLDSHRAITSRVNIINTIDYKHHNALVETQILEDKDIYTYKQKQITIRKTKGVSFIKKDFLDLIQALEFFDSIDFVHGDLNAKNIKYTPDGFKIIDLEPSLRQIKDGHQQFMVTVPYISGVDLKAEKITKRTDKVGLYYFILRMLGKFSTKDKIKLIAPFREKDTIPIHPKDIETMSYKRILRTALNYS